LVSIFIGVSLISGLTSLATGTDLAVLAVLALLASIASTTTSMLTSILTCLRRSAVLTPF